MVEGADGASTAAVVSALSDAASSSAAAGAFPAVASSEARYTAGKDKEDPEDSRRV
jgi:hypothetical protein